MKKLWWLLKGGLATALLKDLLKGAIIPVFLRMEQYRPGPTETCIIGYALSAHFPMYLDRNFTNKLNTELEISWSEHLPKRMEGRYKLYCDLELKFVRRM